MLSTSTKIIINGATYTVRFNQKNLKFEHNHGYKDNNGIRQSRILKADSIAEMEKLILEFETKIANQDVNNNSVTFANYYLYYVDNVCKIKNASSTTEMMRGRLHYVSESIQNTRLIDLKSNQLQLMYTELTKRYKTNTIKGIHEEIDKVLNHAVANKLIPENPNKLCIVKGYQNGAKYYMSVENALKFLNFLKNNKKYKYMYRPCLFMAVTGVRKGECLGVKKDCLDATNHTVKICGQVKHDVGYSTILKTNSSYRTIKLNEDIFNIIATVEPNNKCDFIFTHSYGTMWNVVHFSNKLKQACVEYGIPNFSSKQFRNSYAKTAILNNVSLKLIQNILGHARLSTTADIYGELTNEDTMNTTSLICDQFKNV